MLIAIDHGNYAIKTPRFTFVSGLTEHSVKPPMTDEILEYGGKFWTLATKRLPYMRDKTQDDRFFILTLFAISKELERKGQYSPMERIHLAVGLPPEHFGSLKEKFAAYFKRPGVVKFTYRDKPYSVQIDQVMVFPQAFAAVVPKSGMVLNTLRLFIIDIGGYTTDVLLLQNGKPNLQFCRSLETGVITMNNEVIRKVSAQYDMLIDDEHISAVLQGKEVYLPEEVKAEIFNAAQLHANDILSQLRELQVDLRTNPAIFIGGGSILLQPYLSESSLAGKAEFIDSPNANALGYEMLGEKQLARLGR
ncbi:ParM/StbA family protein [Acutalibacter sp. 1XD8-36]|uniref:ParM/StbA family protein n=1 Tax=Acutalibacter sp. 1XD8-36 TaxID=2320852 RepID=UPI0014121095|nr:ParM/StbA family protein [Acutalibacter sp. 1XD8-36]NBJ90185.1 ParM/StbA family protein [Acutalibacter sp. 1XD8-36]